MAQNNYDDALDTLAKAEQFESSYNEEIGDDEEKDAVHNIKILVLKGQCLCKQKNFNDALEVIDDVINYTKSRQLGKIQYAFALVEKATILAEMDSLEKYHKAIEYQEEAISIL
jgi:tetratricopeptide (TPR) repeat protein